MGHKSTVDISREEVLKELRTLNWSTMTNEQLVNVLEEVRGGYHHGHNYLIIPQDESSKPLTMNNELNRPSLIILNDDDGGFYAVPPELRTKFQQLLGLDDDYVRFNIEFEQYRTNVFSMISPCE